MNIETVWILVIVNIIICIINIANSWALAVFNKTKDNQDINKMEITKRKKEKIIKILDIVLPFIFIISILICVYSINNILKTPSDNLLRNSFNLSLSISTIFFVILNTIFYYANSQVLKIISKINETQSYMNQCISDILKIIK